MWRFIIIIIISYRRRRRWLERNESFLQDAYLYLYDVSFV